MLKKIFLSIASLMVIMSPLAYPGATYAQDAKSDVCAGVVASSGGSCDPESGGTAVNGAIRTSLRILQGIAGLLAVFYIIYAGIKFITSSGSADGVKTAKNTIIYTSVGVLIIILAEGIIRFVLKRFE